MGSQSCAICSGPLDHTPGLGQYMMHPACERELLVRLTEAHRRATRVERARCTAIVEAVGARPCHAAGHDDRWCAYCSAREDALSEVLAEIETRGSTP